MDIVSISVWDPPTNTMGILQRMPNTMFATTQGSIVPPPPPPGRTDTIEYGGASPIATAPASSAAHVERCVFTNGCTGASTAAPLLQILLRVWYRRRFPHRYLRFRIGSSSGVSLHLRRFCHITSNNVLFCSAYFIFSFSLGA